MAATFAQTSMMTAPSRVEEDPGCWIQHAVRRALLATGHRTLGNLNCEFVDGVIVLTGVVSSFYLKQVAQQAVLNLKQSQVVRNVVEVRSKICRD